MSTIKEKQKAEIKQMLYMDERQMKVLASEPVGKILVYDRCGQDILRPLISVQELGELGVIWHSQLHTSRRTIPDVPAVYFCYPTEENLRRIGRDLRNGLYDEYHLNFISGISRQRLLGLGIAACQSNSIEQIQKVYDQYLNCISLEEDLFILKHQNSEGITYSAINGGELNDLDTDIVIQSVADSLLLVSASLGTVPIIRSPRGNAAEMVAKKLDKKLRENLCDTRNCLFLTDTNTPAGGHVNAQRPLLIILDRNVDMATPLHHTWTYQALAHDVLDLRLNRVIVEENAGRSPAGGAKAKTRVCDLDSRDKFWMTHKGSLFPTAAEAIQEELEQYRSSEEEVKRLKASMGIDNESDAASSMVIDNTARLTSAVNSLPQLLEKKRLIDMHTTITAAILNCIKTRRLDTLFEFEEKIMSRVANLDKNLMELLTDADAGNPEDKMRLFIIYYICTHCMSETEFDRYATALQNAGCDLQPLAYIKRWKAYAKIVAPPKQYVGGGTKTVSMFSKHVSQGSSFVMEGIKNLVEKKHYLPVTRIVDDLMELKSSQETEDYRYFDPTLADSTQIPRSRTPFQEAIVFIVGGGNYVEYQNLVDYKKSKAGGPASKRITYGATTLTNAKQFLKELSLLGDEVP